MSARHKRGRPSRIQKTSDGIPIEFAEEWHLMQRCFWRIAHARKWTRERVKQQQRQHYEWLQVRRRHWLRMQGFDEASLEWMYGDYPAHTSQESTWVEIEWYWLLAKRLAALYYPRTPLHVARAYKVLPHQYIQHFSTIGDPRKYRRLLGIPRAFPTSTS